MTAGGGRGRGWSLQARQVSRAVFGQEEVELCSEAADDLVLVSELSCAGVKHVVQGLREGARRGPKEGVERVSRLCRRVAPGRASFGEGAGSAVVGGARA